jgi:hypothetical protein
MDQAARVGMFIAAYGLAGGPVTERQAVAQLAAGWQATRIRTSSRVVAASTGSSRNAQLQAT